MENGEQPLLLSIQDEYHNPNHNKQDYHVGRTGIQYFSGILRGVKQALVLSRSGDPHFHLPILTRCHYSSICWATRNYELAMVSVENSIIAGFCYGIMVLTNLVKCLEMWYMMSLTLFAGYLKDAQILSDASAICVNIMGWTIMAGTGFNSAISVRVSNELGAANPRAAKFSAVVVGVMSSLIGVAIGAGWQAYVAYVNLGCYYIVGIPMCLLMAFKFNMGIQASIAGDRLQHWG
ncbi:hypothetical protein C3L33_13979, partial [Rhododendron williamsianum]